MSFHAIIFDLDGTLLNTLDDIACAANTALTSLDFPTYPVEEYRYFVGDGMRTLLERIIPQQYVDDEAMIDRFLDAYITNYGLQWDKRSAPYAGMPELLDALVAKGLRLGVLSNKPHAFTVKCVEKLLAGWKFDPILGQKDEFPKKPDPAGALWIQQQWGFPGSEILYLGDTGTDMLTAKRAGFFAVGVTWGFRPEEELREGGADFIAHHPLDVLGLV